MHAWPFYMHALIPRLAEVSAVVWTDHLDLNPRKPVVFIERIHIGLVKLRVLKCRDSLAGRRAALTEAGVWDAVLLRKDSRIDDLTLPNTLFARPARPS